MKRLLALLTLVGWTLLAWWLGGLSWAVGVGVILALDHLGESARERKAFSLERPAKLRIYAIGEEVSVQVAPHHCHLIPAE